MKNFQEAIELVLAGSKTPMNAKQIADVINGKKLFENWKGSKVSSVLVLGRANQHNDIFAINGQTISLKERYFLKEEGLKRIRNFISHRGFYNSEQIILFALFWIRMKYANPNHRFSMELPNTELLLSTNLAIVREELIRLKERLEGIFDTNILKLDFLSSLNLKEIEYLCEISSSTEKIIIRMGQEEFIDFFQSLIEYFSSELQSQGFSVINPLSHSELNLEINSSNPFTVFDPFCGSALLVTRLFKPFRGNVKLILHDLDPKMIFITWMNLEVSGFRDYSLKISDYINDFNGGPFDFIVSDPPYWGPKLWQERRDILRLIHSEKTWEEFYFNSLISQLKGNGKALLYVHESILSVENYTRLRKDLLNKDYIQEIRQIDDELRLKKSFNKSLLILSKAKKNDETGFVKYILNSNQLDSKLLQNFAWVKKSNIRIANSTLLKNTANLNGQHVIQEQELQKLTIGWPLIKELVFSISSGVFIKRNLLVAKDYIVEQATIPYVGLKDLSNGQGIYIEENDIELHLINHASNVESKIIQRPGVLVSKLGGNLRPKVFDGSFPMLIDGNIFFLEFDNERVLPEFAFIVLSHSIMKYQVQLYSTGGANRRLNKKNLEQIKFPVKSLELQNKEIKAYLLKTLEKETRLTKETQSKKDEKETTILSSIKHELKAQILEPLTTEFRLIKGFTENKISDSENKIGDLRISGHIKSRKYSEVVEHVESILENANNLFENIQQIIDLNTSKVNLENINILKLIKDCVQECSVEEHEVFTVFSFESNKTQTFWKVDRLKLKNAFSNFIRNTLKHAFAENYEKKYLVFNVAHNQEKNTLEIHMLDNGVGLVGGFEFADLVEFGKQNKSNGTGIGGYLMKKSIEIHNGSFEDISNVEEYISIPNLNNYPFIKFQKEIEWIKIKIGVHFKITIPTIEL